MKKCRKGFTLIELLIVIAVMAILTTVVFVALNPLARFQDSRNNRRRTDVNAILQAIKLHQVDNSGSYLTAIQTIIDGSNQDLEFMIGEGDSGDYSGGLTGLSSACDAVDLSGMVDLSGLTSAGYLPDIPYDPSISTADYDFSFYYLIVHTNGAITIGACGPEQGSAATTPTITVKR